MKLFNIFRKKEKVKDLYKSTPLLDKMWVCVFRFSPFEPKNFVVKFKKVDIVSAVAYKEGVWVESSERDPFKSSDRFLGGYVGNITQQWHWVGFFETRKEAVAAYNKFMDDCISVINEKKVAETTD